MPLNIHPNLRKRLKDVTTEAVSQMRVENGVLLHRDAAQLLSAGDTALPAGDLKRKLATIISNRPFSGFVVGRISDELSERFKYAEGESKRLTELPGFEKPEVVAERLVNAFASLPWSYTFIYPLPLNVGSAPADTEYHLSEAVAVVRGGSPLVARYPTTSMGTLGDLMSGRFSFGQAPPWNLERFYLIVKADGFNVSAFTTQLAKDIRLLIRAFAGLLEATSFVDFNYVASWGAGLFDNDKWIYCYVGEENTWRAAPSVRFDAEHAERIEGWQWEQPADPDIMGTACMLIHPAFEQTDDGALLRRCAQWHFDSLCGTNPLLQFVQATVAIEILLGDKETSDLIGLGQLLANRCAYSLARNPQERQGLLKEFTQIYDTRSAIVHRGKADLSDEETNQLWRLRHLDARLIFNELKLMRSRRS